MANTVPEDEIVRNLNLGSVPDFQEAVEGTVFGVVKEWAEENIKLAREKLRKEGSASGRTEQSITTTFVDKGEEVQATINAPEHAKFIDRGVSGTVRSIPDSPFQFRTSRPNRKMAKAIEGWIRDSGITLPNNIPSYESFAYAIATSVKKKGIDAKLFISEPFGEQSIQELAKAVSKMLGKQLAVSFREITKNGNNST